MALQQFFEQMKEPHHHKTVGYSMIAVSASLAVIGLLFLAIGDNVLYGDDIQRSKTAEFENCKETNFVADECRKFDDRLEIDYGSDIFSGFRGPKTAPGLETMP
jgi:hypothetical protein